MSRVIMFVSSDGKGWKGEVDYQSDLPDPSLHTGEVWLVKNDSGIWPFKKKAGFYRSTGGTWKYLGVSTLGSLTDVDVSSITDGQGIVYSGGGFVPETLALSSHNHDSVYLKQDGTTFVYSNWDVDGQGTFFIDRVNKRIGIGTDVPSQKLDVNMGKIKVVNQDSQAGLDAYTYSDINYASTVNFRRARGTVSSPSPPKASDTIGFFGFQGYDGTQFTGSKAYFMVKAAGDWSTSSTPTEFLFSTTPIGGTAALVRFVIKSDGKIGIGTSTPTSSIDVNGDKVRIRNSFTPASTSDTSGNVGDICWDDNYIYVKTNVGWKRAALQTF